MSALKTPFRIGISGDGVRPLELVVNEHFRLCPELAAKDDIRQLSARQVDLIRWGVAIHLADGWVKRRSWNNGFRRPILEVDLIEPDFWERSEVAEALKKCVDFLSGDDDWTFRPRQGEGSRHSRQLGIFEPIRSGSVVNLYSGGLDSAAGFAARLAEIDGKSIVPVTVYHRARLIQDQFNVLHSKRLARQKQIRPFRVGASTRNKRLFLEHKVKLTETTHRCRPFLFFAIAGLVAKLERTDAVEVYESGIGAVNLPLVSGSAGWRTTRSTHPTFLKRIAVLIKHVNGDMLRYALPFLHRTKGEMVQGLVKLGLESFAKMTVSCITHPYRRGSKQCGTCPACVFRRQAMFVGGIEDRNSYLPDSIRNRSRNRPEDSLSAFRQQVARLDELDEPQVPAFFRLHLLGTEVVSKEFELAPYVNLFCRYRNEWRSYEHADFRLARTGGGTTR